MNFHFHHHLVGLRKENGKYLALENKPTLPRVARAPRRLRAVKKKSVIALIAASPVFRKTSTRSARRKAS